MRVSLATHGGMAAPIIRRLPPHVLDTEQLPADDARELLRLIAAATADPGGTPPPSRARDAMSYTVTVGDAPHSTTLTGADTTMSPAFGALVDWMQNH